MRCFYHRNEEAVGSCKGCHKGLCGECAVDVGGGLACRAQCEDQVRSVNQLVNRNIRISPINEELIGRHQRRQWAGAIFCVAAGVLVGMMGSAIRGTPRMAAVATGVLAVIFGIWQMVVASRMKKLPGEEPPR
jgi:hypothetical protein